jgi:hypothetical protein
MVETMHDDLDVLGLRADYEVINELDDIWVNEDRF